MLKNIPELVPFVPPIYHQVYKELRHVENQHGPTRAINNERPVEQKICQK